MGCNVGVTPLVPCSQKASCLRWQPPMRGCSWPQAQCPLAFLSSTLLGAHLDTAQRGHWSKWLQHLWSVASVSHSYWHYLWWLPLQNAFHCRRLQVARPIGISSPRSWPPSLTCSPPPGMPCTQCATCSRAYSPSSNAHLGAPDSSPGVPSERQASKRLQVRSAHRLQLSAYCEEQGCPQAQPPQAATCPAPTSSPPPAPPY